MSRHARGQYASHMQVERQQAEAERAKQEARELRQYRKSLVFKVTGSLSHTWSHDPALAVCRRAEGGGLWSKLAFCPRLREPVDGSMRAHVACTDLRRNIAGDLLSRHW